MGRVPPELCPTSDELAAEHARLAGVTTPAELAQTVTGAALMALDGLADAAAAGDRRAFHHWLRWQAAVRVAATERARVLAGRQPRVVDDLSPRLLGVAALVAEGLGNRAIAVRIGRSEDTVKHHVSALIDLFGATNRAGVAAAYLREVSQQPAPTAAWAWPAAAGGSR